jgi:hypothetical protein
MKKNNMRRVSALALIVAALSLVSVYGATEAQKAYVNKAIDKVAVSELSAKASSLVTAAKASEKEDIAVASVEAIVNKRPALAATLVASIAKAEPTVAAAAAAKATELNPAQATAIARAAAQAAPKQAAKIAEAVAKVAPKQAVQIAEAIVAAVPSSMAEVGSVVKGYSASTGPVITQSNDPINDGRDPFPAGAPAAVGSERITEGEDYARP